MSTPFSATLHSDLLSREQAARYLGVSPRTLAVWKSTGRYCLPVCKIGRLAKYRKSDLDAFIARSLVGSQPA
jgi:excisionase family DNA binding protein